MKTEINRNENKKTRKKRGNKTKNIKTEIKTKNPRKYKQKTSVVGAGRGYLTAALV